jgi:putative phosphoribosyl transferase
VSRSWWASGLFADRREAGQRLAEALESLRAERVVVLGIPRGGVEVAAVVAEALDVPLDVVIPRKVGAPGNPELGLGAVAEGVEVLDEQLMRHLGVSQGYLRGEIAAQQEEIRRRSAAYRSDRPPVDLAGRVAVVVDDGVATGGTAAAALRWARSRGASKVILAVPVAPAEAIRRLSEEADEVRALATPEPFYAVGQWYAEFPQVSDEQVIDLLSRSVERRVRGRGEQPER